MASWKADVWMGSNVGRQSVEVQANTFHGAREMIKNIYGPGISDGDIWNLREVGGAFGQSSSMNVGGTFGLILLLLAIWLLVEYWWIIAPIGLILFIGLIVRWFAK